MEKKALSETTEWLLFSFLLFYSPLFLPSPSHLDVGGNRGVFGKKTSSRTMGDVLILTFSFLLFPK